MTRIKKSDTHQKPRSALREFLAVENLLRALVLSGIVTALAIPRILIAGYEGTLFFAYIIFAFVSMTLMSGAITAWTGMGTLCRWLPSRRTLVKGLAVALLFGLVFGLLKAIFLDPVLEKAMIHNLSPEEVDLHFPVDAFGVFALICWVAGFETIFFEGGTMSLWSRITGSTGIATGVTVLLRAGVVLIQMYPLHLGLWVFPALLAFLVSQTVGCQLFARSGLLPVVAFNIALQVGLLLDVA